VTQSTSDESPVMRFLLILAARRAMVLRVVFLAALATAVISLVLPRTYQSVAVIAPPSGSKSLISGLLGSLPMGAMLGGMAPDMGQEGEGEYFTVLLNSRQLQTEMIEVFHLRAHYRMPKAKIEDILKRLGRKVSAELDFETSMIVLTVQDKDPVVAWAMASWMVKRLEKMNHDLKTRKASNNRQFSEREVAQIRWDLDSLERGMTRFQLDSRMLEPEEQGKAIMTEYAQVKTQEAVQELKLRLLRQRFGDQHPEVRQAAQELEAIQTQLRQSWERGDSELFLAINQLPAATMDYLRHQRELEIANKKLIFMLPQLEQAKLDEVNDVPVLEVLDPPVVAEKRIKPKRTIMVLTAAFMAFVVASGLALFMDRLERDKAFAQSMDTVRRRLLKGEKA
jgi:tyrosine-protein kinase Etk/Wzc